MMHSPASKDAHLFVPVERGVLHASLHVDPRNVCCTPARAEAEPQMRLGGKKKHGTSSNQQTNKKSDPVMKERSARAVQAALAAVLRAQGLLDVLDVVGVELEAKKLLRAEKKGATGRCCAGGGVHLNGRRLLKAAPCPPLRQPAPFLPPPTLLPLPRHATGPEESCGPLRAGLRVASAPRAAATVAPRGSRGPFFPPRRHLPLRHLAAHERCELLLRLRARLLQGWQGADAQRHLRRARLDARSRVRTRQQAARASARVCAAGLRL